MIVIIVAILLKLYFFTNVYQQSFYELRNVFRYYYKNIIVLLLSSIVFLLNNVFDNYLFLIASYAITIFQIIYFFNKLIISPKITKRVIRLWIAFFFLCIPFLIFEAMYLIDLFVLFLLIGANYINKPIELLINRKYLKRAKKTYNSLTCNKICITGSYGKTSVKNYLFETLKNNSLVAQTPKSYNTPLGISKFINNSELSFMNYLILEFGARRVGDIKKLGESFPCDIAIITEIGLMHIDTFKSRENIINEKMSLLKYLSKDGIAILNYENEYIRNYYVEHKKHTYGFNYGDFLAKNIILSISGTSFDLFYNDNFIDNIKLKLLGRQSVLNVMPSLIISHLTGIPLSLITNLKSVSNRLSLREIDDYYILDDGYNSNILGATYALEVIRTHSGKKFIITPGFVEMSLEKEMLAKRFGEEINRGIDVCILVKNEFTKLLSEYILDKIKVYFVKSFKEGFSLFLSMKTCDSILLIENDLPDAF